MKKDIRIVDHDRGIVSVTLIDERWYARPTTDVETGLPAYEYVPSVTWICQHYPKGIGYYKWLAGRGWDEAEAIKVAAGEKGSKVHQAVAELLQGRAVRMDSEFLVDGVASPLTVEEWECVRSFAAWWWSLPEPEALAVELPVWGQGYAGTVDLLARWGGEVWLIDLKTSQDVWPSHEIQVTAYRDALPSALCPPLPGGRDALGLGILQLGYRRNQAGYKFTEVEYQPELFAAARTIWAKETAGQRPVRRDYPLEIDLARPVVAEKPARKRRAAA